MSSWEVELTHTSGFTVRISLIDVAGPLNDWREVEAGTFTPGSGTFLNQLKRVAPQLQPSWVLRDLDIDEVVPGSSGSGEVIDNPNARFPVGTVTWRVIRSI